MKVIFLYYPTRKAFQNPPRLFEYHTVSTLYINIQQLNFPVH